MMKDLIILVGLKGSGKTTIGSLMQEKYGIRFLRVEDIWLGIKQRRFSNEYFTEGFRQVKHEIDNQFKSSDKITIESIGTTRYFQSFLKSLKNKYNLKLIKVHASPETCKRRVKSRDLSYHIPVSDDILEKINQEALNVDLKFDAVIENDGSSFEEILTKIDKILSYL